MKPKDEEEEKFDYAFMQKIDLKGDEKQSDKKPVKKKKKKTAKSSK